MKANKPLIETNLYLRDPIIRAKIIARSVETSCGVEGIKLNLTAAKAIASRFDIPRRSIKRIYQTIK